MARSAQTSWVDGKSYCYKLTQTGSSVRWVRDDGRSGTARIGGRKLSPAAPLPAFMQPPRSSAVLARARSRP